MPISLAESIGLNNPMWQEGAACKDKNPDWFIAPEGKRNNHNAKHAKAVCSTCSVKQECLEWILKIESDSKSILGIYGGTTQQERRKLRVCRYGDCKNPTTKLNTSSKAQNNFCSEECRDKQRALMIRKAKIAKGKIHPPVEYYMQGKAHH